jgi:putative transposase
MSDEYTNAQVTALDTNNAAQAETAAPAEIDSSEPDLMRNMCFRDTRLFEVARVQERIRREKKRTKVKNLVAPDAVHIRISKVGPKECTYVSVEDPRPKKCTVSTQWVRERINSGDWLTVERDPMPLLRFAPDDLTDAQRASMNRNAEVLSKVIELGDGIFDDEKLEPVLSEIVQEKKIRRAVLKRLVDRFVQSGCNIQGLASRTLAKLGARRELRILTASQVTNGVKPVRVGRPRNDGHPSFLVHEKSREKILEGARRFLFTKEGGNERLAWELTCGAYFVTYDKGSKVPLDEQLAAFPPEKYPSLEQFNYWIEDDSLIVQRLIARYGQRNFNLKLRPLSGRTEDGVPAPGAVFQLDSTRGDIAIVHQITRRPIGRATIYVVTDVFSHLVVGWYVSLKESGYDTASLALLCAASDKGPLFLDYDLPFSPNRFPAGCVPRMIVGDSELDSKKFHRLVENKVLKVRIAPAYRADLKGLEEAMIGSLTRTQLVHKPGYANGIKNRGETNPEHLACLDLRQVNQIVMLWAQKSAGRVMDDYPLTEAMVIDGIVPTPANLWAWGIQNLAGVRRRPDMEQLQRVCLPTADVLMTRRGVQCAGLYYEPEGTPGNTIPEFCGWKSQAAETGNWKLTATYHPERVAKLWLHHEKKLVKMKLAAESIRRSAWSRADLAGFAEEQAILNSSTKSENKPLDIVLEAESHRIAEEGKALTEAARGSVAARAKEKFNKKAERENQQALVEGRPVRPTTLEPVEAPRTLAEADEAAEAARINANSKKAA